MQKVHVFEYRFPGKSDFCQGGGIFCYIELKKQGVNYV